MRANQKPNFKNRPPHIVKENGYYFVTSRTVEGKWFLQSDRFKDILLGVIREKCKKFGFPLIAYALLNNHYHLIVDIKDATIISKFISEINGASSFKINDADASIGRKIWWNYFETILKDRKQFFTHLNYLHQNPIKHCLAKDFNYKYSSFGAWEKKKGREYLDDSFRKYPIIDFKVNNDEL